MRYEMFYGLGATNFLGELGGANREGTNFVRDFEVNMTRPLVQVGIRYRALETIAIKTTLSYGRLKGDDALTGEQFRSNRNLHFRSPLVEFSTQLEYSIIKERTGHRYNLRRVRGIKGFKTNTYFFVGVGGFWFNPRAKYDGKWYSLQPLGTEGQGLVPTRPKYSRVSVCIPYGIGFKYSVNRRWNVGLEFGTRKTFTDYIDDVSSTYYDNTLIQQERGDVAAYLADPSVGPPNWTAAYQQRGDTKDKDAYMFLSINLTYKLHTTRQGLPKFR
ncbi:MAG: hypothetical protein CVU05_14540 [Bacteroidetes bacterium HGW-Bacteroidetes-21]|nr:MAG: hypothetical protein CVU05_14540 [Bacteroidetes bacterium HGW-Bacteroidetes-21]